LFKWAAALAVVLALAASPLIYRSVFVKVEEQIRLRVEAKLAERFPTLQVHVRSARLADEGIQAFGVSISESEAAGPQPELAYFDEVLLVCRTSMQELLAAEPQITSLRITRPVIRATRRPDGSFSSLKLAPPPKCRMPAASATVVDGTVEVFDPIKNPSSMFTLRSINLTLKPHDGQDASCGELDVEGYLVGDQVNRIEVTGSLVPEEGTWTLRGTVEGLELCPELRERLPQPLAEPLEKMALLRARANLDFHVESQPGGSPRYKVTGHLVHGSFAGPNVPNTMTELSGRFECDNNELRVLDLKARDGVTEWEVSEFRQQGLQPGSPFYLKASGKRIYLSSQWAEHLSDPWRIHWKNYDPHGHVDATCTVTYDGQKYRPSVEVTCLEDVSFSFVKFPYRLENGRGTMTLRNDVLDVGITAFSGTQPVRFDGKFLNPGPQYTGWIEIRAEQIAIDEKLFAALAVKPKTYNALRSLKPRDGTVDVFSRLSRTDPRIRELKQYHEVGIRNCSVNYDKFRYELKNVQGKIVGQDGLWTIERLVGSNGSGLVTAWGSVHTAPDKDQVTLFFDAKNVPLEPELRDALHPGQQKIWDALSPQGKIDLKARVDFDSSTRRPIVDWYAYPRNDATAVGTIIEPVAFPYHFKLQSGWVHYHDGEAELVDLHASHRDTRIRASGSCKILPDGGWHLKISKLSADPLRLQGEDRDLPSALPEALRRAVNELKPTGLINLRGALDLAKRSPDTPLYVGWDVELFLHQSSLQVGPRLENIFGSVKFTGSSSGGRYASRGELKLDSATYKNFQVTEVRGPLWLDNTQVVVGVWPGVQTGGQPANRRATAKVLGGNMTADCHVRLGTIPHYHVVTTFDGVDLTQFARENLINHQKISGRVSAYVDLQGTGGGRNLFGTGRLSLTDADVYELPVMVSLLKIARAKPPNTTAFTQSDVAFDIRDRHITLNQINLNGDAINLSGFGELTLDGQTNPINLQLHTKVVRSDVPVIRDLLSEASRQIMLLKVEGPLESPTTRAQAFPAANEALQQLQADAQQPSILPQSGSLMRAIGLRR